MSTIKGTSMLTDYDISVQLRHNQEQNINRSLLYSHCIKRALESVLLLWQ